MKFQEILELIDKVAERGIASVEVEQAGMKLRIEGKSTQPQVFHSYLGEMNRDAASPPPIPLAALPAASPVSEAAKAEEKAKADAEAGLHTITSPIVGTFYRSPSPESPPFVNVGDRITKGKVLCIIEAMKLMNEITSEYEGEIVSVYVENGKPVQYGERLFAIKTV